MGRSDIRRLTVLNIVSWLMPFIGLIILLIIATRNAAIDDIVVILAAAPIIPSLGSLRVLTWLTQAVTAMIIGILLAFNIFDARSIEFSIWVGVLFLYFSSFVTAQARFRKSQYLKQFQGLVADSRTNDIAARHDPLTNLLNRRGILEYLSDNKYDEMSIALLDCDYFKRVNDEFGHQAGDEYLQAIGSRLKASVKSTDGVARWGGDEFIVALPANDNTCLEVLHRFNQELIDHPILTNFGLIEGTISAGVTTMRKHESMDACIARADKNLYRAKEAGRSRVVSDSMTMENVKASHA